ncbi:unnamed protein product [Ectocarpus sp. CCAP 1310/34]|nr:unnamed protein product [Ectocarpus sp. CCAP 1310/34]
MKFTTVAVLACVGSASAFVPHALPAARMSARTTTMSAESPASRGDFLKSAAGAAALLGLAAPALAEVDNPVVPFLGGGDKIDVNNANVRAYIKLSGMYPSAAGKIVSNGPYSSVSEIYNIKGLSNEEKAAIKKHESRFITMDPQAMYTIDRINNGLYR